MDINTIHYRRLTPSDEPFLWDMLYLAIFVPDGNPLPPREIIKAPELARYVDGWGRPDDMGFMALDGDRPVGAAWIRLMAGENKGYGYVDDLSPELSIAVLTDFRGQGIGRELINRVIGFALPIYKGLCLSVSRDNPAVRLYESCGFSVSSSDSSTLIMVVRR